ncbi:arginine/serine-rich protein 1 [Cyclopterus lumpus]|uniref:arginine/serine-rich protein 1 n=1 Tax=Cyclopterus lumpus TaxID=8103 RepID=UPI001487545A|nr:arginine/serine-rich protein 1 [Cyclopterus lumpus]
MAKGEDSHLEIAHVSQSDGINVTFDQNCSPSSRSRSRSKSDSAGRHRRRNNRKGVHRSSSRSRSSSRNRSRSHPRCHRPSSRCRCDNHRGSGRVCRSPPRRHKDKSGSPSPSRHSHNRRNRPHSRPTSRRSRQSKEVSRFSQSPARNNSSSSRSGSSEHSVNLSLDDKEIPIEAEEAVATMIPGVEKCELPENVEPILLEQAVEPKRVLTGTWVRQDPEKTPSQSDEELDDVFSTRMSPKRKTISFSINNAVLKPTGAASSGAKVTSRVDSYESRKPYGHWMPVKSGHAASARKQALAMSH